MFLNDILNIIDTIADISGSNDKQYELALIINTLHENDKIQFENFLQMVYSPRKVFGVSSRIASERSTKVVIDFLKVSDIDKFLEDFKYRTDDEIVLLLQMLNRKLSWGMNTKSINKVFNKLNNGTDLIYQPKYMRCSVLNDTTESRLIYPLIAQKKADSEFTNIFIMPKDGIKDRLEVFTESRSGKIQMMKKLWKSIELNWKVGTGGEGLVLNGELMVRGMDDRSENKSRISSYIQKDSTEKKILEDIENAKTPKSKSNLVSKLHLYIKEWHDTETRLYVEVWDVIPYEYYIEGVYTKPYADRLHLLKLANIDNMPTLDIIESKIMNCREDITEYMNEVLSRGLEGLVVKNYGGIWKDHTSPNQFKVKEEASFEMRVIGFNPGEGEFEGGIGSLVVESEDKLIKTSCSGFNLAERGLERVDVDDSSKGYRPIPGFDLNQYYDKIVEIKATEVSKAKGSDIYSLSYARFQHVRDDKTEADDFEYINSLFKRAK